MLLLSVLILYLAPCILSTQATSNSNDDEPPFNVTEKSLIEGKLPLIQIESAPQVVASPNGVKTLSNGTSVSVVAIPGGVDLNIALNWATKEIKEIRAKAKAENREVKFELMVVDSGPEDSESRIFTNSDVFDAAEKMKWANAMGVESIENAGPAEFEIWRDALSMSKRLGIENAKVILGLRPNKKQVRREDMILSIVRGAAITGLLTYSMVLKKQVNWEQAFPGALFAGVVSGTLQWFHLNFIKWIDGRGYFKPKAIDKSNASIPRKGIFLMESASKDLILSLVYYGTVEIINGLFGVRSDILGEFFSEDSEIVQGAFKDFLGGVVHSSLKGILVEGISIITLSRVTDQLIRARPDLMRQIRLKSKIYGGLLSVVVTLTIMMDIYKVPGTFILLSTIGAFHGSVYASTYWNIPAKLLNKITRVARQQDRWISPCQKFMFFAGL